MKNRTWTYTGNISSFAQKKNRNDRMIITEVELYDDTDESKAPVLLHVDTALMGYILDIEWNDDEERYMRKEFVYDNVLSVREIRVLNKEDRVCKIIRAAEGYDWIAEIFGPVERITSRNQKALDGTERALLVGPESFKK